MEKKEDKDNAEGAESAEDAEKEGRRRSFASLDRKSPPFAECGRAPSSSGVSDVG